MHEHSQTWWNTIYRAIASTQKHAPRHPIKNYSASTKQLLCLCSLSDVLNASKEEAHPKARHYPGCVWSELVYIYTRQATAAEQNPLHTLLLGARAQVSHASCRKC